ncbi:MAG: YbaN family protein, partial [Chromatiales bacterium]
AVWCWSRSAPRLSHRILSHPRFGQPVHRFIEYGMISRPGKWMALSGMAIGYLLLHLFGHPDWILTLSLGFILLLVGVWLWQRPEPMMSSQSQQHAPTFTDLSETPSSAPQRRSCDCPPTD